MRYRTAWPGSIPRPGSWSGATGAMMPTPTCASEYAERRYLRDLIHHLGAIEAFIQISTGSRTRTSSATVATTSIGAPSSPMPTPTASVQSSHHRQG
jgi:hypothetical protein